MLLTTTALLTPVILPKSTKLSVLIFTIALLPVVVATSVEPFCKLQLVASLILSMAMLLLLVVFTVSN